MGDPLLAMPINSVQQAHAALLAMKPDGAALHSCHLCGPGQDGEQEVAHVANETTQTAVSGNVYTEAQHFSLLESAVERETSSLTTEKSALEAQVQTLESEKASLASELSEVKSRIDVLEAEKATAETAAEAARTELSDFKSDLERKREVEDKKKARKDRVKAANESLADDFFSEERITRWAEMSDESFEALVADMTEVASASKASSSTSTETVTNPTTTQQAKETAAFSGGTTPSTTEGESALMSFLDLRQGRLSA